MVEDLRAYGFQVYKFRIHVVLNSGCRTLGCWGSASPLPRLSMSSFFLESTLQKEVGHARKAQGHTWRR